MLQMFVISKKRFLDCWSIHFVYNSSFYFVQKQNANIQARLMFIREMTRLLQEMINSYMCFSIKAALHEKRDESLIA